MADKTFTTIFSRLKNVDLVKMPGRTALYLSRLSDKKIKCSVVTLNNDEYSYQGNFREYFDLVILDRENKQKSAAGTIYKYLRKNSRNIDILNLYHLDTESLIYAYLYKFFNKKGKLLLELDADERIKDFFEPAGRTGFLKFTNKIRPLKKIILNGLAKKSDYIAVELESIYMYLMSTRKKNLTDKLFINPYGIDKEELQKYSDPSIKKENIILTIGRIGSYQKNNEMLLEAVKKIGNLNGWKIYLIGPVESNFKKKTDKFFEENPGLTESVKLLGEIKDRKMLSGYLQSAKVFCLTSRYESWGIVLEEAAYYDCFIVSTDTGCAKEIINNMVDGKIINKGEELTGILESIINGELVLKNISKPAKDEYINKTSWEYSVGQLLKKII
jgi:L-malate glycosyltransferase